MANAQEMIKEQYFGAQPAIDASRVLKNKATDWYKELETNLYLEKVKQMWSAYHGAYFVSEGESHQVTFLGEQGEISALAVNHFRNLGQHMLTMITATRPVFEARATNTDYKSLVQTKLANGLLDYYMRDKRLEYHLKLAVEQAIVLGSGYIKMEWDDYIGEVVDTFEDDDEEGNTIEYDIREGDVTIKNLSVFDVVYDTNKEDASQQDWVLCRSFKNRFDLAAKYPEHAHKILSLPTKTDLYRYRFRMMAVDETEDIPVYEFFHKKTESMPEGRYLLFLESDIVLLDHAMPYRQLPVYRISPSDILGTSYGYSPLFDILPLQDALNSLYTTILTNNNTFGVQNIYVPRGADINVTQLVGGLNLVEGNEESGRPEPLQLTNTSPETFQFIELLERSMETISGINSVARGNPESSLKSGNALALVQSMALQFISGLQQSYVQLIEDVGTGLVYLLQDYAHSPRVAAIAGKNNRTYMKEFKGSDLDLVNRVIVDMGNPLARTTAGRIQMAEQMMQMGVIKNAQQYFNVIDTGRLDVMTEGSQNELLLIKAENEKLIAGSQVQGLAIDQHQLHILEHKGVLADPDLRQDPVLVQNTLAHIQEHLNLMRTTDPDLLSLIGEQPLGGQGGVPINPENALPQQPAAGNIADLGPLTEAPNVPGSAGELGINVPSPASPPEPFENLPTDPAALINNS